MFMEELNKAIEYLKTKNQIKQELLYNFNTFRALMNITMPYDLSDDYYKWQDLILLNNLELKEITEVYDLKFNNQIALFKGDITTIKADVIVNACNEKLLGCFQPLHNCIDNAIHSHAGLQVRRDLIEVMKEQGNDEQNGKCKVTSGYNLPSKYIFHTVAPKCFYGVSKQAAEDLKNCYLSCLQKADEMNLQSIVFCSIATGIYKYPIKKASKVAISTVKEYLKNTNSKLKVVFNLYSLENYKIYERELNEN